MSKKELLSDRPDSDNPEWTDKEARNATQFRNLPAPLQEKLARGKRGPQKAPRKIQTAIRYDVEVDRKSVVKGKRVSVSLDRGVRRNIKKTTKKITDRQAD